MKIIKLVFFEFRFRILIAGFVVFFISLNCYSELSCVHLFQPPSILPIAELKAQVLFELSERLVRLPELEGEIRQLFEQEDLPVQVQTLLWKALSGNDVEINPFGQQDKKDFGFSHDLIGYALNRKDFLIVKRKNSSSFNGNLSQSISLHSQALSGHAFLKDFVIFAPNTKPQWTRYNSLLTVFYELAHVRLNKFLEKNQHILLKGQFPEDIVHIDPETKKLTIDGDFFDYIHERFAFESEFRLFKYLKEKRILFGATPPNWIEFATSVEHPETLRQLARNIRSNYKLTGDPRLAALDRRRIYDILINGF